MKEMPELPWLHPVQRHSNPGNPVERWCRSPKDTKCTGRNCGRSRTPGIWKLEATGNLSGRESPVLRMLWRRNRSLSMVDSRHHVRSNGNRNSCSNQRRHIGGSKFLDSFATNDPLCASIHSRLDSPRARRTNRRFECSLVARPIPRQIR